MLAAGCASVGPTPGSTDVASAERENGRSRAERVFLYQSRVADSLLDHYPLMEIFENADPALIAAEARMTESCSPLTRAILAHLEGEKPSIALRLRVFTSLGQCERAARRIDSMLNSSARAAHDTDTI